MTNYHTILLYFMHFIHIMHHIILTVLLSISLEALSFVLWSYIKHIISNLGFEKYSFNIFAFQNLYSFLSNLANHLVILAQLIPEL